jgi:preprotein translocase subunit SecF
MQYSVIFNPTITFSPKKVTLGLLVFGLLTAASTYSVAGIYRWTDAQGKTHFSDQPPEEQTASEEVSNQLSPINRDSSTQETQKLQQVFQEETPEEKALQQQQQVQQQQRDQKTDKVCQQAKQKLRTLQGPVYFVDKNGDEITISEEEREKRAQQLKKDIRKYCP